jgi:hypothetical protein
MNNVERCEKFTIKRKRVSLDERERIIGLRLNIYADNLKPGPAVADSRAPGATEKVKKARLTPVRRRFSHSQSQRTFPPDIAENSRLAPASRSH